MRIVLILLFISFNAFSQTYDEIMSIKDVDAFKKVCIENGYEFMSFNRLKEIFKDDEDYNEDSIKLDMETFVMYTKNNNINRGLYYPEDDVFSFQFSRTNVFDMVNN